MIKNHIVHQFNLLYLHAFDDSFIEFVIIIIFPTQKINSVKSLDFIHNKESKKVG